MRFVELARVDHDAEFPTVLERYSGLFFFASAYVDLLS